MPHRSRAGAALADILVALILLAALAVGSAPLVVRAGALLEQGRALAEGVALAELRRARVEADSLPCQTTHTGRDSTTRAGLDWRLEPIDSSVRLTAVFQDPAARWPPETLTTLLPCAP